MSSQEDQSPLLINSRDPDPVVTFDLSNPGTDPFSSRYLHDWKNTACDQHDDVISSQPADHCGSNLPLSAFPSWNNRIGNYFIHDKNQGIASEKTVCSQHRHHQISTTPCRHPHHQILDTPHHPLNPCGPQGRDALQVSGQAWPSPRGRGRTRFRLVVLTAVLSAGLVFVFQCLFWSFAPLERVCCAAVQTSYGERSRVVGGGVEDVGSGRSGVVRGWVESLEGKQTSSDVTEDLNHLPPPNHSASLHIPPLYKTLGTNLRRVNGSDVTLPPLNDVTPRLIADVTPILPGDVAPRLPGCLIIGVRKGGTRALLEFLNLHPSVRAHRAELHFFDDDRKYALGLDWYRDSMPRSLPDQVTLEKTPAYFVEDVVPWRVRAMNASVRLLLTMRDPVERAISDYEQIREKQERGGEPVARFEDLALHGGPDGEVNEDYPAVQRSVYHHYMARWLHLFPLSQFHFVNSENLVRNPVEELRRVETFLGLPARINNDQFYLNITRGFYCMRGGGSGGGAEGGRERCLAASKGRAHSDVAMAVRDKLRGYFREHNERFYQMVGVDFGWPT